MFDNQARKFEMQVANSTNSNRLNLLFQIQGIIKQVWGTSLLPDLVIISSKKTILSSISLETTTLTRFGPGKMF